MSAAATREAALPRRLLAAVLLVSLAVLMLQIVLNRIFSFTIWYHFAYISISLALLGFGAAGSLLAAFPGLGARSAARGIGTSAILAAIASLVRSSSSGACGSIPSRSCARRRSWRRSSPSSRSSRSPSSARDSPSRSRSGRPAPE